MSHDWIKTLTASREKLKINIKHHHNGWGAEKKLERNNNSTIFLAQKTSLFLYFSFHCFALTSFPFCYTSKAKGYKTLYCEGMLVMAFETTKLNCLSRRNFTENISMKTLAEKKSNRHVFMDASLKMNSLSTYSISSFISFVYGVIYEEIKTRKKRKREQFHKILLHIARACVENSE